MASGVSRSSLQDLWKSSESQELREEGAQSSFSSSLHTSVESVNWIIVNRGGFAFLTGLAMVPSQFLGPNAERSHEIIAEAERNTLFKIDRVALPIKDTSVKGIIYYPSGWNGTDHSRCVLYHNPNGITVSGYFEEGQLSWTPAEFLKIEKCPILMYDYRGTGLSSDNTCMTSLAFQPTYESVVVDGEAALKYALKEFGSVCVIGSSLGGGVATVSLDRHLKAHPADGNRVRLVNHDSFTTTSRVVIPGQPHFADWIGWLFGGFLDAETSMRSLVNRQIPITVLCHRQDPVIPEGARMAEFIETLPHILNVSVIYSQGYGHGNLSPDMIHHITHLNRVTIF